MIDHYACLRKSYELGGDWRSSRIVGGLPHGYPGNIMVKIHVKKGDDSQFLYDTTVEIAIEQLVIELVRIYNGRLKVERISQGKL